MRCYQRCRCSSERKSEHPCCPYGICLDFEWIFWSRLRETFFQSNLFTLLLMQVDQQSVAIELFAYYCHWLSLANNTNSARSSFCAISATSHWFDYLKPPVTIYGHCNFIIKVSPSYFELEVCLTNFFDTTWVFLYLLSIVVILREFRLNMLFVFVIIFAHRVLIILSAQLKQNRFGVACCLIEFGTWNVLMECTSPLILCKLYRLRCKEGLYTF